MPSDILAHREKMSRRICESCGMDRASGRIEGLQRGERVVGRENGRRIQRRKIADSAITAHGLFQLNDPANPATGLADEVPAVLHQVAGASFRNPDLGEKAEFNGPDIYGIDL